MQPAFIISHYLDCYDDAFEEEIHEYEAQRTRNFLMWCSFSTQTSKTRPLRRMW